MYIDLFCLEGLMSRRLWLSGQRAARFGSPSSVSAGEGRGCT